MGKRATSTTKGGRFMNPADQERKMARKKELKKNKKQRSIVRQAVLKSKDASDLLQQMEKLDEMEFGDVEDRPLSDRVIQEKKQKLRETFLRILGMYKRENELEKFAQMKQQLQAYDHKRKELEDQYIAQKFAREADPSDIPLPDSAPPPPDSTAAMTPAAASRGGFFQPNLAPEYGAFPAAPFNYTAAMIGSGPAHGILKKARKRSTFPPGPPVGPPPELSDDSEDEYRERDRSARFERRRVRSEDEYSDEDEDMDDHESGHRRRLSEDARRTEGGDEYDEEGNLVSRSRVRFDDGGDVDDSEEKDSRSKYKELARRIERGEIPSYTAMSAEAAAAGTRTGAAIPPPASLTMVSPGVIGAPSHLVRPSMAVPGLNTLRPGVRMPPPPPPGFPPTRQPRPPAYAGHVQGANTAAVASVLSAPPAINKSNKATLGAVIEAKPQLRNMQQEVTKLVPTAVKIRREHQAPTLQAQKKPKGPLIFRTPETKISVPGSSVQHAPQKSTDEAYDAFMKEMKSLL